MTHVDTQHTHTHTRTQDTPAELAQALDLKKRLQIHREWPEGFEHCSYVGWEIQVKHRTAAVAKHI